MPEKDPIKIAEDFAVDLEKAFGENLQAVLLVGSAARGDFVPGKSDINTLVILSPPGMDTLEKAYPVLKNYQRQNLAVPHFMTAESVRHSLDSYPLEILDFKTFHRVVLGPDVLSDLVIPHQPLRLQIEREARGKLLLLRQALAIHAGQERELSGVLRRALSAFAAIFQGIMELEKRPIPADRAKLFAEAEAIAGLSAEVFQKIADLRAGRAPQPAAGEVRALFKGLLREVNRLVAWVDAYKAT